MRTLSKLSLVAILILAASLSSSAVSAQVAGGSFTLSHAIRWQGNDLPAGNYTFSFDETAMSGTKAITVRGDHKIARFLVTPNSTCDSCQRSVLTVAVGDDSREVVALDLPGLHMTFHSRKSNAAMQTASFQTTDHEEIALRGGSH